MKHLFFALSLVLGFSSAQAKIQHPYADVCAVVPSEEDYESEVNTAIEEVENLDIDTMSEASSVLLSMLNDHVTSIYEVQGPLTLAQIKELYSDNGPLKYDDLYVLTWKVKATGRTYVETKSYPGDNSYGFVFTPEGKVVATNGDDDYTLLVEGKKGIYCSHSND